MRGGLNLRLSTVDLAVGWLVFVIGAAGFEAATTHEWSQVGWLSGVVGGAFVGLGLWGRRRP